MVMNMIKIERFNEILVKFKKNFTKEHWNDEKFKWEAVKRFQEVWDVNASDFLDMFMRATDKTYNLLAITNKNVIARDEPCNHIFTLSSKFTY